MRDTTERPEGVEAGTLKLVGTQEETIYEWFTKLLDDEAEYSQVVCNVVVGTQVIVRKGTKINHAEVDCI